jgi:hypothetical protein
MKLLVVVIRAVAEIVPTLGIMAVLIFLMLWYVIFECTFSVADLDVPVCERVII